MGSICQIGAFGNHADSSFAPLATGPHNSTRKSSLRGQFESEHVFPHAALKLSNVNYSYGTEPTMSIPYAVHRGAQGGAGGGVSSTGSSGTASGWSGHLGSIAQTDFPSALRLAVIDQLNAHWINGNLTNEVAFQIIQVVNSHATLGRLTSEQAGEINNEVADMYYRHAQ